VEKLPPASWMRIDASGKVEQKVWWTLPYGPHEDEKNLTLEDWRDRVLDSTREAVAIRQRAAVDVGVLLSGGVDSSMLVGLLREVGVEDLSTFSIGFQDAGGERGDEFQYSDLIAKHYGTRHHQLRIQESEIIEQLPAAFRAMSEPMVSHDCIAFYLLSREVSKHCKVVQSGQGADELFAGYHWYPQVDGASDPVAAYRDAFVDRSYAEYAETVQPKWRTANDAAGDFVRDHFAQHGASAAVDKALRLDSTVMLVDDPVKRVDNMTMAWGLEARTPFLDYRLVELSARIPGKFKLPDGGKQVLKEAARLVIPSEVIDRKKGYFPVPGLKHLQGDTLNWVRELLTDSSQDRGLFNPAMVDKLLTNPEGQLTPLRGSKLWQLAALNLWLSEQGL
ncbi:N-acetylglutaminylglutamine amidotransferase, partial [Pseudomonas savastanoi]